MDQVNLVTLTIVIDAAEHARWLATAADDRADSIEQWLTMLAISRYNVLAASAKPAG